MTGARNSVRNYVNWSDEAEEPVFMDIRKHARHDLWNCVYFINFLTEIVPFVTLSGELQNLLDSLSHNVVQCFCLNSTSEIYPTSDVSVPRFNRAVCASVSRDEARGSQKTIRQRNEKLVDRFDCKPRVCLTYDGINDRACPRLMTG